METGYYSEIVEIEGHNKFNLYLVEKGKVNLIGKYQNHFGNLDWKKEEGNPFRTYNLVGIEHRFKILAKKFDSTLAKKLLEQDSPEEVKKLLTGFFE